MEFCGGIWKETNSRIFEDKGRDCYEVVDSILREVGSWLMIMKEFKKLSLSLFYRDWVTSISIQPPQVSKAMVVWKAPALGW